MGLTFILQVRSNNINKVLSNLDKGCRSGLAAIGRAAAEHANEMAPVDTGALSSSYTYDLPTDRSVRVGSALNYAPYVELGTGPNYERPPGWITNNAEPGHHAYDPWWYLGDDGEWHLGYFVRAQPHLRPAFLNYGEEYQSILEQHLR